MSYALRPYQEVGRNWLNNNLFSYRALWLADEDGVGKTAQVIAALHDMEAERTLIVCPAGARHVWRNEILRWRPEWAGRIVVVLPKTPLDPRRLAAANAIVIVSYDSLSLKAGTLVPLLRRLHWTVLVCDEAHYLKGPSNRTFAVYGRKGSGEGLQAVADRVILLSGTPAPNHLGELWHHLRALWPEAVTTRGRVMTESEFQDRYTQFRNHPQFGRIITGSKNQAELRAKMQPYVLRRTKRAVLPELPPVQTFDAPLDLRSAELFAKLHGEDRQTYSSLQRQLATAGDDDVLAVLRRAEAPLATLRREIGEAKVDAAVQWIVERFSLGVRKLVVFGWHISVLQRLHRQLAAFDPVLVTGDTPPSLRTAHIDHFQTRDGTRLFIGQIIATGTAITLTAASEVVILEPSWVPGENVQAIGRAHRLGQRDSVFVHFLYAPNTLDERIMAVFRRKARQLAELTGDQTKETTNAPQDAA